MRKHVVWIIVVCVLLLYIVINTVFSLMKDNKVSYSKGKIALINIEGAIEDPTHVLKLLNTFSNMSSSLILST